jgi:YD repeat-containing protein
LTGTDSNSTQLVSLIEVIVSGENKPGRMVVTSTDLVVPLAGLPIKIARRYDSLERKRVDDFGMGWSLQSGNVNLEVNAHNDVTFTDPATSRRVTFRFTPRRHFFPISWGFFPSYTPEPGTFGTLATDGCSLLTRQDDGSFQCSFTGLYTPTTFAYTDSRGTVFTMTIDGNLHSIKTVNGETLTFSSTGITSSSGGTNVAFVRDGQGRITQITDPAGKVYAYGYSGGGDLTSVDLPDVATNVSYTYNTDHLLLTSTDARGNPEATATYYSDGRLQSITDALNQTTSYAYNLTTNTTTTTNPDGGVETRQLDANGMLLNETNALGQTTTYT